MGKTTTTTYAVHYETTGRYAMTTACWKVRGRFAEGAPTAANLARYMEELVASFLPGGANQHCPELATSVTGARLVHQASGEVVARWDAPLFRVVASSTPAVA